MRFLDRQAEMGRLHALCQRRQAGLVTVWGRRRVGKTRLLIEWCREHDGLYTVADQSAAAIQRQYFASSLARRLPGFDQVLYPDWRALLERLSGEAARAEWHGPLVLDEFPALVAADPSLPSVLQNWIDAEARRGGLLAAIAGSSQHMMQGLVLDASAALFGRSLEAMPLAPLPAGWLVEALGIADTARAVRAWTAWGGIPRYWELAEPFGDDVNGAVDSLVLDPLGPLHGEPDRLLLEETPPAASLRPILDAIGSGVHRPTEIAGRLQMPVTSLARPLARLQGLGLVRRDVPFGDTERGGKRALYALADPFFRAWFRVVAPHRGLLAQAPRVERLRLWRDAVPVLCAQGWEDLCRQSVPHLATAHGITADGSPWGGAARWWHGTAPEWDIVAASAGGGAYLVGEAKWCSTPMQEARLRRLARDLGKRQLPPSIPAGAPVLRILFVPAVRPGVATAVGDILCLDATAVLAALRT